MCDKIYKYVLQYAYLMEQDGATQNQQLQPMYTPNFYSNLNRSLFRGESEKSFIDKLLGRQDADKLHELIKKEPLTRADIEAVSNPRIVAIIRLDIGPCFMMVS